jgi:hypothetical protein
MIGIILNMVGVNGLDIKQNLIVVFLNFLAKLPKKKKYFCIKILQALPVIGCRILPQRRNSTNYLPMFANYIRKTFIQKNSL